MDRVFHLKECGTNVSREMLSGFTTFLTMMYILFVNPTILSEAGMPATAVFVATAISAGVCTIIMAFFANTPFAMAPGMGLNTFFTYTVCIHMDFHWEEALAVTFLAGVLHIVFMASPLRKSIVNSIPTNLQIASSVGIGMFIGYVGILNAGFLEFTSTLGQYVMRDNGTVVSNSTIVPAVVQVLTPAHILALISLGIMIVLLALEKRTGESYAALAVGILTATFIGIPLNITNLNGVKFMDFRSIQDIQHVFLAFLGRPGLLSLFENPTKLLTAVLAIMIMLVTNLVDSLGTVIGVGRISGSQVFDKKDLALFAEESRKSKLDKTLMANSLGGTVSGVFGSSVSTLYVESITGVVSGGRTGLTALVTGLLFFICLPLSSFFSVIPRAAIAPALIVAGSYMMTLIRWVNWKKFEDYFPAFITIVTIPSAFGIIDGICCGILCHIIIQIALGKRRKIPIMLYAIGATYTLIKFSEMILMR